MEPVKFKCEEKGEFHCEGIIKIEDEVDAYKLIEVKSLFIPTFGTGSSQSSIAKQSSNLNTTNGTNVSKTLLSSKGNNSQEVTQNIQMQDKYFQNQANGGINFVVMERDMKPIIANDVHETFDVSAGETHISKEFIYMYNLDSLKEEHLAEEAENKYVLGLRVLGGEHCEESELGSLIGKVSDLNTVSAIHTTVDKTKVHSLINVQKQIEYHQDVPILSCFHCSYTTTNKASIGWHMVAHVNLSVTLHGSNQISETLNVDQFSLPNAKNSGNDLINGRLQKCGQCSYFTTTTQGLVTHTSAVHGPAKHFLCTLCSQTFSTARGVRKHTSRIHTQTNLFYCFNCTFSTKRKKSIEQHMELHTGVFSHSCSLCDFQTASGEYLIKHMKLHNQLFTQYFCEYCDFKTFHRPSLKIHIRRHKGEKPFRCSFCGKRFVCSTKLKDHMDTHSTEKPHICTICDFRSRSTMGLHNHHANMHLPGIIFSCNECDFRSKSKKSIEIHLMKHTGERPYGCNICSFRTYHQSSLQVHMNKHSRKKVYNCSDCNYTTTHAANFGLHRKRHTGIGKMTCFGCGHTTTHRSNFAHHVNKTCTKIKSELFKKEQ